jgi:hypothetical protein
LIKRHLIKYRAPYYQKIDHQLIIESYSGWYGLIPVIRETYLNYKIIVIIRDPRQWVRSNMDWGKMYGHRDLISKLGYRRLSPFLIQDTAYMDQWQHFDQFQKLCWIWSAVYEILLDNSAGDPNIKVFKFEDVFYVDQKTQNFKSLIEFIANFGDKQFDYNSKVSLENILNHKIHKNIAYDFPDWPNWPNQRAQTLDQICGALMKKFGYGNEELWKDKLNKVSY